MKLHYVIQYVFVEKTIILSKKSPTYSPPHPLKMQWFRVVLDHCYNPFLLDMKNKTTLGHFSTLSPAFETYFSRQLWYPFLVEWSHACNQLRTKAQIQHDYWTFDLPKFIDKN